MSYSITHRDFFQYKSKEFLPCSCYSISSTNFGILLPCTVGMHMILNFVVLFILILVGLFVLSVPQFDLSSLSVASFYLYFPSVALLLVYCILYLSFAITKKEHSALEKILNVYTALMIATIVIAVCASLIVTLIFLPILFRGRSLMKKNAQD